MAALGIRRAEGESTEDIGISPITRLIDDQPRVPAAARPELTALGETLIDCSDEAMSPSAQVDRIRRFYDPIFQRVYDDPAPRLRDLDQLAAIAAGYPTRERFITELALDPPQSTADLAGPPMLDEEWLTLSTIHSAKGCEWDVVHVIHAADGMIPSDMAAGSDDEIEEELRLFYVAMTRARHDLYIYFPLRYYMRPTGMDDAHGFAQLTRFLPSSIHGLFERRSPAPRPEDQRAIEGSMNAPQAVAAFLADLWKA
jgi:DNA helicase-2/ATP-dependent DNA helicase PcrA